MTEKHLPLSSQNVPPSQAVLHLNIDTKQDDLPTVEPIEDEDYTIDCICGFTHDDGSSVYCEPHQTWQHLECFYPNNAQDAGKDDFEHRCHRCKPRPLSVIQEAIERQRARADFTIKHEPQAPTQKVKRPAAKSHKKKTKPSDLQLNGHSAGAENIKPSHNLPPPTKKAKNSHKASQSISSQAAKRSPSNGAHRPNHHPPSPARTPPDLPEDFELHTYSPAFLDLCSKQQDVPVVQANSYASLSVASTMGVWPRDPDRMEKETGHLPKAVFQPLPTDIEARQRPLNVESKRISLSPDKEIQWSYLVTPTAVNKDVPLMELNGMIGMQRDYCEEPEHKWGDMPCPLPFVFFHPMLPLYIDTRGEGSQARFVRRSCDPNANIDTFLKDGSEYQFWLVSEKPIAANEQVTLPWDIKLTPGDEGDRILRLLCLRDDKATGADDEIDEAEYNQLSAWVKSLLDEHGGCACNLGSNCSFARFHRNYFAKIPPRSTQNAPRKKGARKTKAQAISPTSTGPATNSRAASEGQNEENQDPDARSTSGSRSKPPSRDLTPARQGSFDTMVGILTEPTEREKRKVAMVEDSFRRLEQQPPRKKKPRISDGTGSGTSAGAGQSGTTTNPKKGRNSTSQASGQSGAATRQYVDAATSGSKPGSTAGSPTAAMSSNLTKPPRSQTASRAASKQTSRHASVAGALYPTRPHYRDSGSQTDFPGYDGLLMHPSHFVKRPARRIGSLNKRIFENNRIMREEIAKREKMEADLAAQQSAAQQLVPIPMEVDGAVDQPLPISPTTVSTDQQSMPAAAEDTPMTDASPVSPTISKPASISATGASTTGMVKVKSPELRVQLPPVPAFNSSSAVSATTPLSASPVIQSPFGIGLPSPFGPPAVNGIANPSPVKKKLSLSDYTKNRKAAAAGKPAGPPVGTNLKPIANSDDPKSASSVEMAIDSPAVDKAADATPAGSATSTTAPVNGAL